MTRQVYSGKFGIIAFGYSDQDSWDDWTPDPWLPPEPPEHGDWDGPVKALIAWDRSHLGYCPDILLRLNEKYSSATTGTSGTDLYDTSVNFNDMNVITDDYVYNITDKDSTTVASVVSDSQLQLTDDISLDPGDEYAVIGAEWHGVTPSDCTKVLDVKTIRDGNNVGCWVLGRDDDGDAAWYASNIFTTSPSWSKVRTELEVETDTGVSDISFQGIAVDTQNPEWAIISFNASNTPYIGAYTNDLGGNWGYSNIEAAKRFLTTRGVAAHSGTVWISGATKKFGEYYLWDEATYISTDGGQNFSVTELTSGYERVDPMVYGGSYVYITDSDDNKIYRFNLDGTGYVDARDDAMDLVPVAYHDGSDIIVAASGDDEVVLSEDHGGTWSTLLDNDAGNYFGAGEPIGHISVWKPDQNVLMLAGRGDNAYRPLHYSPDQGGHMINITTNWEEDIGDWKGVQWGAGTDDGWSVGIIPLPRVGANA
jgi:hypothetical protein